MSKAKLVSVKYDIEADCVVAKREDGSEDQFFGCIDDPNDHSVDWRTKIKRRLYAEDAA